MEQIEEPRYKNSETRFIQMKERRHQKDLATIVLSVLALGATLAGVLYVNELIHFKEPVNYYSNQR